ncbi:hypothetical protein SG34_007410 [Thalassomonas viridans]|uniref:SMODS-associating 2TM beta-strand rich effector domain-containing protein n=1 Tax=Thalassomonas viridans TaxID=137584 RepID=A0AAE9Z503_9GAMM|nr:hypothetical protein [Thalassomonas viridans]WDE06723.1 hypothetical protein SG34_007410 [Thalassomonas viridans]
MQSEHKFHSYITVFTVVVMYFMIQRVAPLINGYDIAKPVAAFISAVGIYNIFAKILLAISRNWLWLKKHFLGASFVNGTWVGKFTNSNNETIFTVEYFDQTLNYLVIRGEAFRENGESYAQWLSKATHINEADGVLTYTYTCDKDEVKSTMQGVCVFSFQREAAHLPPSFMKGYSADLVDGVRDSNSETKVSDSLVPLQEAITLAKEKA